MRSSVVLLFVVHFVVSLVPVSPKLLAEEQEIVDLYINDPKYTDEYAYQSLIDFMVDQPLHAHLKPYKDFVYDVTEQSQLPPNNSVIGIPFIRDCVRLRGSGLQIDNLLIQDNIFSTQFPDYFDASIDRMNNEIGNQTALLNHYDKLAHRDAIQLIPVNQTISQWNSQYAGAKLNDISISNVKISSVGLLQGIFASDGCFENLRLKNITVETHSVHQISLLGLLSGTLDLVEFSGNPLTVNLLPLRLGGGRNIYIHSFSIDCEYQYGRVISGLSDAVITDNRLAMNKAGNYYGNFSMETFFTELKTADPYLSFLDQIEAAAAVSGILLKIVQ